MTILRQHIYTDIHTHNPQREGVLSIRNYSPNQIDGQVESMHSVAIHPYDASEESFGLLENLLKSNPIAIGETGLDYRCNTDRRTQYRLFEAHIDIATINNLPLIVHSVHAIDDTLAALRGVEIPVVIHGFTGHIQSGLRFIEQGFYLSFGYRTIDSTKTIETLRGIPINRLFVESDDSAFSLEKLYAIFAEFLGVTPEELALNTEANFKRIFER